MIIRVPRSWLGPHMVTHGGTSRFFVRDSAGKHQLDVTEIREAFLRSQGVSEKIQAFRDDRVSKIFAGEAPVTLDPHGLIVCHIIPVQSVQSESLIDLRSLSLGAAPLIRPIANTGYNQFVNFDGLVRYTSNTYVQVFQNGIVEGVDGSALTPVPFVGSVRLGFPTTAVERRLMTWIANTINALEDFPPGYPFSIHTSLLRVKGYRLPETWNFNVEPRPIDRDVLYLPNLIVYDPPPNIGALLRPVFDSMWRAMGVTQSLNYDNEGNWKERYK